MSNNDQKRKILSAETIISSPLEVIVYFEDGTVETFTSSKMESELSAEQITLIIKLCKENET